MGTVRFAGYAAIFDVPDRGGDIVRRDAFALARPVPLLWQHGGPPVGVVERIGEDSHGLRVSGRIDAPALADAVASGRVQGLSFGYRARGVRQGAWRELTGLDLIEVSLVASPMQPLARVEAVA